MNNLKLLFTLIVVLFSFKMNAQIEKQFSIKEYKRAKKMKFCKQLKIEIDTNQYVSGEEKIINYQIYSIHERKNKSYTFLYSTTDDTCFNHISDKQIQIEFEGLNENESKNQVLIKKDLSNCKTGSFTIKAFLKSNPSINSKAQLNLIQNKQVTIDLNKKINPKAKNEFSKPFGYSRDSNFIHLYFKKIISEFNKEVIYISAIDYVFGDTITHFIDSTSKVTFTYYPYFYSLKIFVDENITIEKLNFQILRMEYSPINYEYYQDNRDRFMVMDDNFEELIQKEKDHLNYLNDLKNIQKINIPNNIFKK